MDTAVVLAEAALLKNLKTGASRLGSSSYHMVTEAGAAVYALSLLSGEVGHKYVARCDRKFRPDLVDVILTSGRHGWIAIAHDGELLHWSAAYANSALHSIKNSDFKDLMLRAFSLGLPVVKFVQLLDQAVSDHDGAITEWMSVRPHLIEGMDIIQSHS